MAKKFYYLDGNNSKKRYVGKVINDYTTNETYGLLTIQENYKEKINLEYHPAIDKIDGWSSYFTYIDKHGNVKKYNEDLHKIRNNGDNSYFFMQVNKEQINLNYHPGIPEEKEYFTYIDNGKEVIYEGNYSYDKFTNTYYFYK